MAETDPLGEIFTMFAAPIAGTIRSVEQFRSGVDEFLKGVENFNRTMANLNETTERINALLSEVEEPIRASVPQFTRSVKAADELMKVVSGPAIAAAPAFSQIADTIATPAFQQLPERVNQFNEMMVEMSRRLGPLTQFAETAGGLFGLRFPGMPAPATRTEPSVDGVSIDEVSLEDVEIDDELTDDDDEFVDGYDGGVGDAEDEPEVPSLAASPATPTASKAATRKAATKKAVRRKDATKKASTKKSPTNKSATNKTTTKKTAVKKPAADRPAAKKPAAEKAVLQKPSTKQEPAADGSASRPTSSNDYL
jgi:hypothetical protein